jgi:hypothetical protein
LLTNFISLLEVDEKDCLFQQNGNMAQTEHFKNADVFKLFGGRINSRNILPLARNGPRDFSINRYFSLINSAAKIKHVLPAEICE